MKVDERDSPKDDPSRKPVDRTGPAGYPSGRPEESNAPQQKNSQV